MFSSINFISSFPFNCICYTRRIWAETYHLSFPFFINLKAGVILELLRYLIICDKSRCPLVWGSVSFYDLNYLSSSAVKVQIIFPRKQRAYKKNENISLAFTEFFLLKQCNLQGCIRFRAPPPPPPTPRPHTHPPLYHRVKRNSISQNTRLGTSIPRNVKMKIVPRWSTARPFHARYTTSNTSCIELK